MTIVILSAFRSLTRFINVTVRQSGKLKGIMPIARNIGFVVVF